MRDNNTIEETILYQDVSMSGAVLEFVARTWADTQFPKPGMSFVIRIQKHAKATPFEICVPYRALSPLRTTLDAFEEIRAELGRR
jgi:hypothetical protein